MFGFFKKAKPQTEAKARTFDQIIAALDGNSAVSSAGVSVTEDTALQVATAMACVELVARDVAALPLHIKRQEGDRSVILNDTPAARILGRAPNPWQTAYEFKEQMTAHAVLRGNAYAMKVKTARGETRELWPLRPNECKPEWVKGEITYTVSAYEGQFSGVFTPEDVFHLRGLSWDGLKGLDRILTARGPLGLSSALEGLQAQQMENGSRPSGILTTEQNLKPEQIMSIAEGWRQATTGKNQYRTPVLDGGFKFLPIIMNASDSQLIETRKHQITEVCAAFGVLPAVLGVDDKTQAFASVEAMMRWHLAHTLRPWLVRWEQSIDRELLDKAGPVFAKFDTREMEKASTKERAESYRTLVELGIMTRNEARDMEGLPPLPGGDDPLMPMNMQEGQSDEAA